MKYIVSTVFNLLEVWDVSNSHVLGTSTSTLPGFFVASTDSLFSSLKKNKNMLKGLGVFTAVVL